ncbi:TetR/AcrR family transcriptional regulator [Rhodococcus opacus]|uniref:TetR/AcrR family transcriptional regulator n=1 Tax=Rhodococcus opacus TaxID=37919 RepID=UPI002953C452|nr:TetR/AcrR family transcriptional regulator [Rhodococcus opacus]MDV7088988.1 TetR/AcrR family transcriptional regulator [Rhodococcus opacus]
MSEERLVFGQTKDQLLKSAVHLFSVRGYNQTTIQQVVDHAGLTKGAFYHYFDSKDDILRFIHDSYLSVELDRATDVINQGLGPGDTLRALTEAMLETIIKYRDRVTILARERMSLSEDQAEGIRDKRDEFAGLMTSVIERGIAEGVFRPVDDPRLAAFALIGMCSWVLEWYKPGGPKSIEEIAHFYSDLFIDGLAKDPGPYTKVDPFNEVKQHTAEV